MLLIHWGLHALRPAGMAATCPHLAMADVQVAIGLGREAGHDRGAGRRQVRLQLRLGVGDVHAPPLVAAHCITTCAGPVHCKPCHASLRLWVRMLCGHSNCNWHCDGTLHLYTFLSADSASAGHALGAPAFRLGTNQHQAALLTCNKGFMCAMSFARTKGHT